VVGEGGGGEPRENLFIILLSRHVDFLPVEADATLKGPDGEHDQQDGKDNHQQPIREDLVGCHTCNGDLGIFLGGGQTETFEH